MVSRYTLIAAPQSVARHFGLAAIDGFPPRYNIAPGQPIGIVRLGYDGERAFALVRWGLLPAWVKDPAAFGRLDNARLETLLAKPSFRNAVKYRRCLLPMNGYFAWTGPSGNRRPVYVSSLDGEPFAAAALREDWMGADGSELETAAPVTAPARSDLAWLGARMPAIVAAEHYAAWLDWRGTSASDAVRLVQASGTLALKTVAVDRRVANPLVDEPSLLHPADDTDAAG